MNTYDIDQGVKFGTWNDETSLILYEQSTRNILSQIKIPKTVADYGGANGIMKKFIPHCVTIDKDPSKHPDVVGDILTHVGKYELIIIRYVLHYLNDYEVIALMKHLNSFHHGAILIIQFCNDDLIGKYTNSINEFKFFRTEPQLNALLNGFSKIYSHRYRCTREFYKNRLNFDDGVEHDEIINAYHKTTDHAQ